MQLTWSDYDEHGVSEAQVHPVIQGLIAHVPPGWSYSAGWSGEEINGEAASEAEAKEMVEQHLRTFSVPSFITEAIAVPHLDFNVSLDHIKRTTPGTSEAVDVLQTVIEDGYGFVTLIDEPGSGKTHMLGTALHTLCRAYLISRDTVPVVECIRYGYMVSMIDGLRALYSTDDFGQTFNEAWQKLLDIPALLIDDIDKAPRSDWSRARIYELIDHRYRGRYDLVTIMAANTLKDLTQPIRSRIEDQSCFLVKVGGKNLRKRRR